MYLFTRRATLRGNEAKSMAWAAEVNAYVDAHTEPAVSLWRCDFGHPVGTVVWAAWVESHAGLQAAFAPLTDDAAYSALIDQGQDFVGDAPVDEFRQPLRGGQGDDAPPLGAGTTVTAATIANGKYTEAMAWGVQIAEHVETLTSLPTSFLIDAYGPFGQVTWIQGAPDAAAVDRASDAMNADEAYLKLVSDAADLFLPGSGDRQLYTRIA